MTQRRRSVVLACVAISIVTNGLLLCLFAYPLTHISSLMQLMGLPYEVGLFLSPDEAYGLGMLSSRVSTGEDCSLCSVAPELCAEVGKKTLARSVSYEGSNERLRRFLAKVRSGQPFTVGVVGGSVSHSNGFPEGDVGDEPREPHYRPQNMHRVIFEHLHALSPLSASDPIFFDPSATSGPVGSASGYKVSFGESGKKDGKNTLINGAQGGTGSGHFAYCWGEYLDQDTDLFITELAINDEPIWERLDTYELLVRSMLDLPQQPAVINIESFATTMHSMALGGEFHRSVNEFYDIPSISMRNAFFPQVLTNGSEIERLFNRHSGGPGDYDGIDRAHASRAEGHRLAGQLVGAYINKQLCEMEKERRGISPTWPSGEAQIIEAYPVSALPRMRLNMKWDRFAVIPPMRPQCNTMKNTRNAKLAPISQTGWRTWSHGDKHYWISTEVGARIAFAFYTAIGRAEIHYLRSQVYGLGNVRCWIDEDKEGGKEIQGWWEHGMNIDFSTAFDGITPGNHIMHCENSFYTADPDHKHEFRITSLTSI